MAFISQYPSRSLLQWAWENRPRSWASLFTHRSQSSADRSSGGEPLGLSTSPPKVNLDRPNPPEPPNRKPEIPAWTYIVQYVAACVIVTVWLILIVLDAILPDYDVPILLYMVVLVVIVFLLPGSERIATVLINAVFRRGSQS